MDNDEEQLCLLLLLLLLLKKNIRSRRRFWVHPYLQRRPDLGRYFADVNHKPFNCHYEYFSNYVVFQFLDMTRFPNIFHSNFHMNKELFDELFAKIEKHLRPKRKNRPDRIPAEHRLSLALE